MNAPVLPPLDEAAASLEAPAKPWFVYLVRAQALVYVERCADKPAALREERGIKQLKKSAKEALVACYLAIQAADGVPSA